MITADFIYHGDVISYVASQLPRQVADKVSIQVESDAYHLRTIAKFKDFTRDRVYECQLEPAEFGSRRLACRIPDSFLAHLCAVV